MGIGEGCSQSCVAGHGHLCHEVQKKVAVAGELTQRDWEEDGGWDGEVEGC